MDVESLHTTTARPRSRCMNVFLVVSVIFICIVVGGALAAGGILVAMHLLRPLLKDEIQKPLCNTQQGDSLAPMYKINSAYLQPTASDLRNGTMKWASVSHGERTSIGGYFSFNKKQQALRPMKEGDYILYLNLNLTCTSRCNAGRLTVHLGDQLTCHVELPERNETPVNAKCSARAKMDGTRALVAQMTVPPQGLDNWRLELNESKFEMVLLD